MGLLERIADSRGSAVRSGGRKDWSEPPFWAWDGLSLPLLSSTPLNGDRETVEHSFEGYVEGAYKAGGLVFACIRVRQMIFAEARFQWRQYVNGRPGNLFGSPDLGLLEQPWPGGTTGELLARMIVTADLAGAYYATVADGEGRVGRSARGDRRIVHLRPDWTTIIITSRSGDPNAIDARIAAFSYQPPPTVAVNRPDPVVLLPEEVCFYSPQVDPLARFRGMSWITPLVDEIRADRAATQHKGKFFDNGATLGPIVTFPESTGRDAFNQYVELFKIHHRGTPKAYETTFMGGGATVANSMADFRQLDFTNLQGRAETRIASAAGIHPTLVGFSEGLQGSSLNAGNFTAAARLTANITMRPLWRIASASLQALVTPPQPGASLWYDDRDIAFLHEDATDLADIRAKDAQTLRALVDGGYDPDAAVDFVTTNDLTRLRGSHSGLLPVQLQPPGTSGPPAAASLNGRANGQVPVTR